MKIETINRGETLRIGETTVTLIDVRDGYGGPKARIGLSADISISIDRIEVRRRKRRRREDAS